MTWIGLNWNPGFGELDGMKVKATDYIGSLKYKMYAYTSIMLYIDSPSSKLHYQKRGREGESYVYIRLHVRIENNSIQFLHPVKESSLLYTCIILYICI